MSSNPTIQVDIDLNTGSANAQIAALRNALQGVSSAQITNASTALGQAGNAAANAGGQVGRQNNKANNQKNDL